MIPFRKQAGVPRQAGHFTSRTAASAVSGYRGLVLAVACLTMLSACAQVSRSLGWRSSKVPAEPVPELNPAKTAEVQFALGRTLEQQGKRDQARVAYESSLRHDKKNGLACWRLAVLAAQAGNNAGADRYFGRAVELLPESAEIHTDIGYSHYLRGDLETATMHLRQAITLHDAHERAHNILGLVLAMQGHELDAAREFHAAGLDPADIACNLGYVALRTGNAGKADEMYAHALDLVPDHPTANDYLAIAVAKPGKLRRQPNPVQHADWLNTEHSSATHTHQAIHQPAIHQPAVHQPAVHHQAIHRPVR